ncbi:hypothetical protein [Massilia sp. TS11]|uniref:hypothetical protein n=1 Tax=Massilia sp. TS11 TaxID=2908003 RepID=UPI001EDB953A|nr:hypothetical protein [Massilia sp. TS11]MCG2583984.1 hypothetical protein [Massilia sp. TS11]
MTQPSTASEASVPWDDALMRRFAVGQPDYVTYPEVRHFAEGFGYADYLQAVAALRARPGRQPLSVAITVPEQACKRGRLGLYLSALKREIDLHARLFGGPHPAAALHVGGPQAVQLSEKQMDELLAHLRPWLQFSPDGHGRYVIEASAARLTRDRIDSLRNQGFDHIVLHAGPLRESEDTLDEMLLAARAARFQVVAVAVEVATGGTWPLAGLQAVTAAIYAGADRVLLQLPADVSSLETWRCAVQRLGDAGYVSIGAREFVRASDPLAAAQRQGRLFRDLDGFACSPQGDWIACGAGAIGSIGGAYLQNADKLDDYLERIENNTVPVARGLRLSLDDLVRRSLMFMLLCNGAVSQQALEQAFPLPVPAYFRRELAALRPFVEAGVVEVGPEWIAVSARGRLLLPALCQVFDKYRQTASQPEALVM